MLFSWNYYYYYHYYLDEIDFYLSWLLVNELTIIIIVIIIIISLSI